MATPRVLARHVRTPRVLLTAMIVPDRPAAHGESGGERQRPSTGRQARRTLDSAPAGADHHDVTRDPRTTDVLDLWQELTGVRLGGEQRREFLARKETQQLAEMSHDRLRRAASAVFRKPDHPAGTLKLAEWLRCAVASPTRSRADAIPGTPNPFGSRDIHAAPVDSDLHRKIGPAQSVEE
jgi:hypothetical protein